MSTSQPSNRQIVTVTLNPALDVSTAVPAVTPEHKLRCERPTREPGGGGINVARVVSRLGLDVTALTVAGGAIGNQLVSLMESEGLNAVVVPVGGETRQSLAVSELSTDRQFRFVLPGPPLDEAVVAGAVESLQHVVGGAPNPLVVISGSVPPGSPSSVISELVAATPAADVIIDTSGPALAEALHVPALLIKPSVRELQGIVGRPLETEAEVLQAASEVMKDSQVKAMAVSIGAGGVMLITPNDDPIRLRAPTVRVRSAVGAGDSLVGGMAVGLARGHNLSDAVALGVAAGTAAVMTEGSRLCSPDTVDQLLPLVMIDPHH